MAEHALVDLTMILLLGMAAQWLAWRFRWPAILLLLLLGFLAGPLTHFVTPEGALRDLLHVDPDTLFGGGLLQAIVSLSVAIILFEGGLTLRLRELQNRAVVIRLITVGVAITWVGATLAGRYLAGLDWPLAALLGAVLTVTGPTVIMPLLRHTRLKGRVGPVLKWEGILVDPVGAVLAVLVFEVIVVTSAAADSPVAESLGITPATSAWAVAAIGLVKAIAAGTITGAVGAAALIPLLRRYLIPDYLQSSITLAMVAGAFAVSNHFQPESGLIAVTLMGAVLANQKWADVKHIAHFKENLRTLLISILFIVLSARLEIEDFTGLGWSAAAFVAVIILLVRPVSVLISSIGTALSWRERGLVALVAPRGIVAAAVTSAFALELSQNAGIEQAAQLPPLMFVVIVGTIAFSGTLTGPAARLLRVTSGEEGGYLIIGADPAARQVALALQEQGVRVLLLDNNWSRVRRSRMAKLDTHYGNVLDEEIVDALNLEGIGRVLALTGNDELNSLALMHLAERFDRADRYQLPPESAASQAAKSPDHAAPMQSGGRLLFNKSATYHRLVQATYRGAAIKATKLTEQFDYDALQREHAGKAVPLFYKNESGRVIPFTTDDPPAPTPGQTVISLIESTAPAQG